jgi:hypothetical protein
MTDTTESLLGSLFGGRRRATFRPTETLGATGTAIYGGYVVENEKEQFLSARERFKTFSEAIANTAVVGAGVRYFLNLIAKADWTFEPADHPDGVRLAEMVEQMVTEDPQTSWARIVRRAAMYRFYGFSIQEWTARRREDGVITLADVAPRAQITVERWDVDRLGNVLGVVQRSPQNQEEIYLPRGKIMYLVDDSLNDSPQGLGLFRHIVEPVRRLNRYEQLEAFGFESDLRGIPIGKAPYEELKQLVAGGRLTIAEAKQAVLAIETFIRKHVKNPELGLIIDSSAFRTTDERQTPSSTPKYDVSLLEGSSSGLQEVATAIERLNREIARVLGVEMIILGDGSRGSFALARDKSNQFSLTVDASQDELAEGILDDLVTPLFMLNGWPVEAKPKLSASATQYRDVEQMTQALRDMAQAGAMITPDDPAVNDIRALLGLSLVDPFEDDLDESLTPGGNGPEDPEDMEIENEPTPRLAAE